MKYEIHKGNPEGDILHTFEMATFDEARVYYKDWLAEYGDKKDNHFLTDETPPKLFTYVIEQTPKGDSQPDSQHLVCLVRAYNVHNAVEVLQKHGYLKGVNPENTEKYSMSSTQKWRIWDSKIWQETIITRLSILE